MSRSERRSRVAVASVVALLVVGALGAVALGSAGGAAVDGAGGTGGAAVNGIGGADGTAVDGIGGADGTAVGGIGGADGTAADGVGDEGGARAAGESTFRESIGPAGTGGGEVDAEQAGDADTIRLRNELFATAASGTVGVRTRAEIPDRVTELRVTLLSATDAAVEADGFEPADDAGPDESVWVWDGETTTPSLTYAMDANDTAEEPGPLGARGTYRFVDAGEWALVRTPRTSVGWSYTGRYDGQVRLARENAVDGEGVASQAIAFLGPHEEYAGEADGQRYRLIVPEAADVEATPDEVFGTFEGASAALRVGARDETVFAVAAPTGGVEWAVRGLQTGDADLWVRDVEPAGTAADVWTHEYVHTRQAYRTDASGRWFTEGSATYYAALFALDRGAADFEAFERTLAGGERDPDASAVLADPGTWERNPDYTKGALVAGEIDRRIRVATGGSASLATVLRDLNGAEAPISNEDVLDAVEAAAAEGASDETAAAVRAEARRLTTTRETAETWNRAAHAEAFGETPARVGYALDPDGIRATGEYRDRRVGRGPVELVAGETLALAVDVTNTGGVAGGYDLALTVDGEVVGSRSGSVAAGGETTERFERAFPEPGEYAVRIAGERLPVAVAEPAPPSVRGVSTDVDRVNVGESVRVTATVGNDAGLPAGSDVEFRVDGETVATVPVRLDVGAERTVERIVSIREVEGDGGAGGDGAVTVSVVGPENEASTTVAVAGEGPMAGSTDDGASGFGPVIAAVAVLAAAGLFGRRDP